MGQEQESKAFNARVAWESLQLRVHFKRSSSKPAAAPATRLPPMPLATPAPSDSFTPQSDSKPRTTWLESRQTWAHKPAEQLQTKRGGAGAFGTGSTKPKRFGKQRRKVAEFWSKLNFRRWRSSALLDDVC